MRFYAAAAIGGCHKAVDPDDVISSTRVDVAPPAPIVAELDDGKRPRGAGKTSPYPSRQLRLHTASVYGVFNGTPPTRTSISRAVSSRPHHLGQAGLRRHRHAGDEARPISTSSSR